MAWKYKDFVSFENVYVVNVVGDLLYGTFYKTFSKMFTVKIHRYQAFNESFFDSIVYFGSYFTYRVLK
jgi:uncharacterized protein YebE (UPF0316 family)